MPPIQRIWRPAHGSGSDSEAARAKDVDIGTVSTDLIDRRGETLQENARQFVKKRATNRHGGRPTKR
jgi:hypothetical protein